MAIVPSCGSGRSPDGRSQPRTIPRGVGVHSPRAMPRLEHVDAIERRPWSAAGTLRADSRRGARASAAWSARAVTGARKAADEAVDALERVRCLRRQPRRLADRFPDAALRDGPGLVKAGRPRRNRGQRLESHPRPIRRRRPGGRGRELRLQGRAAGDPRRARDARRGGRDPGGVDAEELRGARDMRRQPAPDTARPPTAIVQPPVARLPCARRPAAPCNHAERRRRPEQSRSVCCR